MREPVIGCIVGGAIGDAMGGPYEGNAGPVTIDVNDEWRISDDTQLTLATCEAMCEDGKLSPERVAARFVAWFRARRLTGVGASTFKALRDLELGAHWALSGCRGEKAAGNGAAMRIAPLAFCLDPDRPEERGLLRDICRVTHHNDEAYVGALAIVESIRSVVFGSWTPGENLALQISAKLPDTNVRDALISIGKLPPSTPILEVAARCGCSGYVAESVPFAVFASQRAATASLGEMLRQAIQAGGDTDTIASMAGQIAGARLGMSRIPAALIARLPEADQIVAVAARLADKVTGPG